MTRQSPPRNPVRAEKERSASQREDPIHLGAATWQCEGEIRRAERREQRAESWEPQSGSALAETERLSASECLIKSVTVEQAQEAGGLNQNGTRVGSPDQVVGDGDINPRRTNRTQPTRSFLPFMQQGKPHPSRHETETRPQARVTAEGVKESRSKRRLPCNGADRAAARWAYPARKGADFRQVSAEAMRLDVGTDGDVRR
jgi:hypothetical protein